MKWILLILLSTSALSLDISTLRKKGYQIYQLEEDDTFDDIAEKYYKKTNRKFQSLAEFKDSMKEWNPHLDFNLKNNYPGQYIYVSYPYSPNMTYKWAPDLSVSDLEVPVMKNQYDGFDAAMGVRTAVVKKVEVVLAKKPVAEKSVRKPANRIETKLAPVTKKKNEKSQWFGFAHVTISQGQFSDTIGENQIDSEQNSPFTIGTGLIYLPASMPSYSIASSIYYSQLTGTTVSDLTGTVSGDDLSIPAEIGGNLYLQKNYGGYFSNLYGGLDYEQFNTYNFNEIIDGSTTTLEVDQQKISYLTGGIGLRYKLFKPVTMKFSYSYGVSSATDLDGTKFMIYFNQKISKNFWYHLLYKQHMLEGDGRELAISRYGIGVGTAF